VDSQGEHINGEGNYGFCGADCDLPADLIQQIFGARGAVRTSSAVVFGSRGKRPS